MLVNDGHLLIDSVVSNVCGSTEVTYIEKKKKRLKLIVLVPKSYF